MEINPKLLLVADGLDIIAKNIRIGNSNISEDDALEICGLISLMTNPESKLSKYQAIKHLKISRATFDNYVKKGLLPVGREQQGFKEKFWYNRDLWKFKEEHGQTRQ